jgi:LAS superfamily LD-carboxypeptidase LdcB
LTDVEFKELFYARLPSLPGTALVTSRPPIYGDAAADARIQRLAEQRGYRLQATPTVPLGTYGGLTLAADAGRAWEALLGAARANGTPLRGTSGYRSIDAQRFIFRRELDEEGRALIGRSYTTSEIASGAADAAIESVLAFNSIPGYSRHHTAKTVDMAHAGGSIRTFSGSAAYRWISADNYAVAKRFGFIPNYPPDAGPQDPNPEPWEFGFVGTETIRCAVRYIDVDHPDAARICGGGATDVGFTNDRDGTLVWHLRTPDRPDTDIPYGTTSTDTPVTGDRDDA